MVSLRCPRCSTTVEAYPGAPVRCPACGFFGVAPATGIPDTARADPTSIYRTAPAATVAYPTAAPTPYAPRAVAGKPRAFWLTLLLGIVTLGVYFYIWNYVTFRELDHEHGDRHASTWFWIAVTAQLLAILVLVVASAAAAAEAAERQKTDPEAQVGLNAALVYVSLVFQLVSTAVFLGYLFQEIAKVETYRQRHGLPDGLAPVWFVILYVLGPVLAFSTVIAAYLVLTRSVNGLWKQIYSEKRLSWPL